MILNIFISVFIFKKLLNVDFRSLLLYGPKGNVE